MRIDHDVHTGPDEVCVWLRKEKWIYFAGLTLMLVFSVLSLINASVCKGVQFVLVDFVDIIYFNSC